MLVSSNDVPLIRRASCSGTFSLPACLPAHCQASSRLAAFDNRRLMERVEEVKQERRAKGMPDTDSTQDWLVRE